MRLPSANHGPVFLFCLCIALATGVSAVVLAQSRAYSHGELGVCPNHTYHSNGLTAPILNVLQWSEDCVDGASYLFAPRCADDHRISGPTVYDERGELVWKSSGFNDVHHLSVQHYQGEEYLTFWAGSTKNRIGHGIGNFYMLNHSYDIVYNLTAARGQQCDFHEFRLTSRGTALMTIFKIAPADLSPAGGPLAGFIWDCTFQEVDLVDNSLVFQWKASDYLDPNESQLPGKVGLGTANNPYDAYHINSIDIDEAGDYIVSFRHLDSVICISGTDGQIIWQLGGLHNNFAPGLGWANGPNGKPAIGFHWQHHVHWDPATPNAILMFNNYESQYSPTHDGHSSHGLLVRLDFELMTADLIANYSVSADQYLAVAEGSVQRLEDGGIFLGYGSIPAFSRISPTGYLQCEIQFGSRIGFVDRKQTTYRILKHAWKGTPNTKPDVAVRNGIAYFSWNGATEVVAWTVAQLISSSTGEAWIDERVAKKGYETAVRLSVNARLVKVEAEDSNGEVLGVSSTVPTRSRSSKNIYLTHQGADTDGSETLSFYSRHFSAIVVVSFGILCVYVVARMARKGSRRSRIRKHEPMRL